MPRRRVNLDGPKTPMTIVSLFFWAWRGPRDRRPRSGDGLTGHWWSFLSSVSGETEEEEAIWVVFCSLKLNIINGLSTTSLLAVGLLLFCFIFYFHLPQHKVTWAIKQKENSQGDRSTIVIINNLWLLHILNVLFLLLEMGSFQFAGVINFNVSIFTIEKEKSCCRFLKN